MNFWGVGSVGNVGSVGKSMIFQHSQCFQCFQCSKKRGTPLKIPPHCERSSHQTQRREAHKFHKGETARQGRQHSAGGAHKLHKGETARQGRQHSAGGTHKLTREKQHGRVDSTVQKSAQAPQDGKSDNSGKQERGRQAFRSCGFGGRCSENL